MAGLANNYLYEQKIPQLFESLMTGLVYHKPEDPIAFLQSCLEGARGREGQYSWNCFISTAGNNSRNVFSRTKPLPPIEKNPASGASSVLSEERSDGEVAHAVEQREAAQCSRNYAVPTAGEEKEKSDTMLLDKPLVFILGGPGCGKGTQCERIVSKFGLTHLSAGDLLREEVARGSPQGHSIQETMQEGQLVPPEVTIGLLKSAILSEPEAIGFLIDGFPRELSQAHMFKSQVCECSVVVMLECSEEVMLGRLKRRGETSGRVDDNDATIRKRMATFSKSTLPVIQHYQVLGKVKLVNAGRGVDEVYCEMEQIFQELLTKH